MSTLDEVLADNRQSLSVLIQAAERAEATFTVPAPPANGRSPRSPSTLPAPSTNRRSWFPGANPSFPCCPR